MTAKKLPALPQLLSRKIYKSGQTRGADDDVIFQNRVARNSTVLIPYHQWIEHDSLKSLALKNYFENGYIVLIPPQDYFSFDNPNKSLKELGLIIGENSLVFYETRYDWNKYNPSKLDWSVANSRVSPLGGEYVARVPGTTSNNSSEAAKINLGYSEKSLKGAGIRLYEYADSKTIEKCRLQLEAIYWLCFDSVEVASQNGMDADKAKLRKEYVLKVCNDSNLLDISKLHAKRIINSDNETICPLCLERLSGKGFLNRLAQPEGREVPDLTVTEINLFHIDELKYGCFNHKPYNLGWGHHFCNVVVKDSGIEPTLKWMRGVLDRNTQQGFDIE